MESEKWNNVIDIRCTKDEKGEVKGNQASSLQYRKQGRIWFWSVGFTVNVFMVHVWFVEGVSTVIYMAIEFPFCGFEW